MNTLVAVGLFLVSLASMTWAASTQLLFVIQRSTNKNEVHYDARLKADGKLDANEPVEVYWLMLAEDGRREDLNWIERQEAYGFSIEPNPGGQSYRMTLKAEKKRAIKVYMGQNKARAEIVIDGEPSFLERIFIEATEGEFRPKVHFVDLIGSDAKSGDKRTERIIP